MKSPTALEELIEALRCLPGVGPKSAQRIAYHLLQYDKTGAARLAESLGRALQSIRRCGKCNSFTEHDLCTLCGSAKRDPSQLCVVETPGDLLMMEQTLPTRVCISCSWDASRRSTASAPRRSGST